MRIYEIVAPLKELSGAKGTPEMQTIRADLLPIPQNTNTLSRRTAMRAFAAKMAENGYTQMGSGTFGAVFTHPKLDYVVKVFKDDPAYRMFLDYCMANPRNPHLPRFRGKIMKIDDRHFVVRMEKLSHDLNMRDEKVIGLLDGLSQRNDTLMQFQKRMIAISKSRDPAKFAADYLLANQLLVSALIELRDNRAGFDMDIQSQNMMKRDQTLVIIDPYFSSDRVNLSL